MNVVWDDLPDGPLPSIAWVNGVTTESEPEDGAYPVGRQSIRCSTIEKACEKVPDLDSDGLHDLVIRRTA